MKNSIVKGVIGNSFAQITLKVIHALDQLLLIPFFLTAWGAAYYGEWVTLTIIPAILGFTDLGVGSAAGNSFVLAYVAGERQKAANLKKSGLIIITGTIFLGVLLTICILYAANWFKLFDKTLIPANEAIIAVAIMMVAKLFTFYYHLIAGFFRGARKSVLGNFIYSGYFAANLLSGFCALSIKCGVVGYAYSQLIVSILFIVIYYHIGCNVIDLKQYNGRVILSDIKSIIFKGFGYMINMVWQSIYFQGGTLVVRLTLGPESVALFNTARTACRSVSQILNIINGSVYPELQYEYGKRNMHVVHRLFRLSIFASFSIGLVGVIFLSLFGLDIYNLWTQNTLLISNNVWYTFIIGILFNGIWWTSIVAYSVTNNPYNFAIPSTIVACLSVGTSYILSIYCGLWGAVFGAVLFDIVMSLYVLPDSCRILDIKFARLFTQTKEDLQHFKRNIFKN